MDKNKKRALKKASFLFPLAKKLSKKFSMVNTYLLQTYSELTLEEHIAISLYHAIFNSVVFAIFLISLGFIFDASMLIKIGIYAPPFIGFMIFYSSLYNPKVQALKKARAIDSELPYALRHLLIEVKSGVPLYQSMVALTEGYGVLSEEFNRIIRSINTGKSQVDALEFSILRSPSLLYRRSFWQLLNALKTGTDLEKPVENMVKEIIREQLLSIKKYGQELNPWTLMYMMFAVIIPSLGITFMMILSTFTGGGIPNGVFLAVLVFLIFFQTLFINVVKSKRPTIKT